MNGKNLVLLALCFGFTATVSARRDERCDYWVDFGDDKKASKKKKDHCDRDRCDTRGSSWEPCGVFKGVNCQKEIIVNCCGDSGCGTLRWAVEQANASKRGARIIFNFDKCDPCYDAERDVWCIQLKSPIDIAECVWIDGYSQCGAERNCDLIIRPNTAKIKIEVKPSTPTYPNELNGGFDGFRFLGGSRGSRIEGLAIYGFVGKEYAAVRLLEGGIEVAGCYLSLRADGESVRPNTVDIMALSNDNVIGGESVSSAVLFAGDGCFEEDQEATGGTLGAITLKGKNNLLANVSGGLNRRGDSGINPDAQIGVYVTSDEIPPAEAFVASEYDLIMNRCALAGYSGVHILSPSFDAIKLERTSVGTDRSRNHAIFGNGIGVAVFNEDVVEEVPGRGMFTFSDGVVSGTTIALIVGVSPFFTLSQDVETNATLLNDVLINKVFTGTSGDGRAPLANQNGTYVGYTKKLRVNDSIFSSSAANGFTLLGNNFDVEFNRNGFGTGVNFTRNFGNAQIGLRIELQPANVIVFLNGNRYSYNDVGICFALRQAFIRDAFDISSGNRINAASPCPVV